MRRRLRMLLEFEDVAGEGSDEVTEGEILEAMDGAFELLLSEDESESIDDLEAAVMRMQYEVNRQVHSHGHQTQHACLVIGQHRVDAGGDA